MLRPEERVVLPVGAAPVPAQDAQTRESRIGVVAVDLAAAEGVEAGQRQVEAKAAKSPSWVTWKSP